MLHDDATQVSRGASSRGARPASSKHHSCWQLPRRPLHPLTTVPAHTVRPTLQTRIWRHARGEHVNKETKGEDELTYMSGLHLLSAYLSVGVASV